MAENGKNNLQCVREIGLYCFDYTVSILSRWKGWQKPFDPLLYFIHQIVNGDKLITARNYMLEFQFIIYIILEFVFFISMIVEKKINTF